MFMSMLLRRTVSIVVGATFAWLLVACSSQPTGPQPAELGPNPTLLGVRQAWVTQIGRVDFALAIGVEEKSVVVAGADNGKLMALNAVSGTVQWQWAAGRPLSAGVGADARVVAVVTQDNELIAVDSGRELWRARLSAKVLTAPLVAGGRVFVLAGDRSVVAFDARSGAKLWAAQNPGETLVLRQAGVLTAVNNTLVAGLGARLVGIDPSGGQTLWTTSIANPRGTNEVERLVDLVAGHARNGAVVCVRAFQATVGCVDAAQGRALWRQNAVGSVGVHGDDQLVFGVETDGRILTWQQSTGQQQWASDTLRYRRLSAPLVLGRSVIFGDEAGRVHFLSRTDGSVLTRLTTDGSAITTTPLAVDNTLVVVTRNGGVFGFQPE